MTSQCSISVYSLAPPAPQNVNVTRVNATSILVQWELIDIVNARGHIRGYHIMYDSSAQRERAVPESVEVDPDKNHKYIDGLIPKNGYTVTVSAQTSKGLGDFSIPFEVMSYTDNEGTIMYICRVYNDPLSSVYYVSLYLIP